MKKIILLSVLLLSFIGCSSDSVFQGIAEDSNDEALIEEASIAIDDQDYDGAISTLASIYDTTNLNPEVSRLMASAYMGKSGIDVINLISFSTQTDVHPFDMGANTFSLSLAPTKKVDNFDTYVCSIQDLAVLMTTSGGEFIDGDCIADMLISLSKAKRALYILHAYGKQTPDDTIQYGIASAAHFVLAMGYQTATDLNYTYSPTSNEEENPGAVSIPISQKAYNLTKHHDPWTQNVFMRWNNVSTRPYSDVPVEAYQEDLININNALISYDQVLTMDNSVRNALEAFLRDILNSPGDTITDSMILSTVSSLDYISQYINALADE